VTPTELPFEQIWCRDFEFISRPGEPPDVVCLVAHELRTGQTLRLWRDQLGAAPPYRTDARVLAVSYVENAESLCHLALGWPRPKKVLDLSPAFRNITNGRRTPAGKGLIGALAYYGIPAIATKHKDAMRDRIIQGWPFTPAERESILKYCESDVEALAKLLPKIIADRDFDLGVALYHGEFASVSAAIEYRGVPLDMEIAGPLIDDKTWREIRDAMVPKVNAHYGVYTRNAAGDWVFSTELWIEYLKRIGLFDSWPRLESGKLNMKEKVFEEIARVRPELERLRQLRHMRNKMRKIKLAIGADGRNRTVLWPFKSKTGRTQPKAAKWIFSPAVWLRSLIKPGPGMAIAYIDYSAMEFCIGASQSDGHCGTVNRMLDMYRSGDPYRSFAIAAGAIPAGITTAMLKAPEKYAAPNLTLDRLQQYAAARDRYKVMVLAVQYGMGVETLAARLGVSTFVANEMLAQHRQQLSQYWAWSNDYMQQALQTGVMRTAFSWYYRTGILEFNDRSIRNWPIQSAGADILRIAIIMAERRGLRVVAPVHDAVLLEAPIDRIDSDVSRMQEIMRRASRIVLNADPAGDHEIRTGVTIVRYPDRYVDPRGTDIWDEVMELLASIQRNANEAGRPWTKNRSAV
jgi:hypothetical protein